MLTGSSPGPIPPPVLPSSWPRVETEPEIAGAALPVSRSDAASEHDATLLLAALAEIRARQAALEWLLDRELLGACLV